MVQGQFNPTSRPTDFDAHSTIVPQSGDFDQPLAEHALQKLQHLQAIIEETSTELRHIERLISKALLSARHS